MRLLSGVIVLNSARAVGFIGKLYTAPPLSSWRSAPAKASDQHRQKARSDAIEKSNIKAESLKNTQANALTPLALSKRINNKATTTPKPRLQSTTTTRSTTTTQAIITTAASHPTSTTTPFSTRTTSSSDADVSSTSSNEGQTTSSTTGATKEVSSSTAAPAVEPHSSDSGHQLPSSPTTQLAEVANTPSTDGKTMEEKVAKAKSPEEAESAMIEKAKQDVEATEDQAIEATRQPTNAEDGVHPQPEASTLVSSGDDMTQHDPACNSSNLEKRVEILEGAIIHANQISPDKSADNSKSIMTSEIAADMKERKAIHAEELAEANELQAVNEVDKANAELAAAKQTKSSDMINIANNHGELAKQHLDAAAEIKETAKSQEEAAESERNGVDEAAASQKESAAETKAHSAVTELHKADQVGSLVSKEVALKDLEEAKNDEKEADKAQKKAEIKRKEQEREEALEEKKLEAEEKKAKKKADKLALEEEKEKAKELKAEKKKEHEAEKKEKLEQRKLDKAEKKEKLEQRKLDKAEKAREKKLMKFLAKLAKAREDSSSTDIEKHSEVEQKMKEETEANLNAVGGVSAEVVSEVSNKAAQRQSALEASKTHIHDILSSKATEVSCPLVRKSIIRKQGLVGRDGVLVPEDDEPIRHFPTSTAKDSR